MKNLERLQGETARDYAFRVLKDNIVSLELKPGTLVSENETFEEFRAVESGQVYCAMNNMYQETSKMGNIIAELSGVHISLIISLDSTFFCMKSAYFTAYSVVCSALCALGLCIR